MLKRLALLALFVPAAAQAAPRAPAPRPAVMSASATRAALNDVIPGLLAAQHVPSVSIAQIRGGRVVLAAAWGEQSAGVPATTRTLYNIASLTKPLTAEIVLRLTAKGQISLDEPMYKTWTDPDIAADPRRMLLTPRLALSHQTGFPNWRDEKTGLTFKRDPGVKFGYSGEGYQYVARFAEKKTGRRFEDLAQAELFEPMGMKSTSYVGAPWFDGRVAVPADGAGQPLKPHVATHFNGADLVYTTPSDYAAFLIGVLKNQGLNPATARERSHIQATMMEDTCAGAKAATCPTDTGYGLGWQVFEFPNETVLMHTGRDEGVFTLAYLNRTTGDGAVILTSGDNGGNVVMPILERLSVSPAFIRFLKGQMG